MGFGKAELISPYLLPGPLQPSTTNEEDSDSFSRSAGGHKSKVKLSVGLVSSEGPEGEFVLISGNCQQSSAWFSDLSVSVCLLPFPYKDNCH